MAISHWFFSKTFITYTLFGDDALSDELLKDGFLQFVSPEEKDVITSMLNEFVDGDSELLDILSMYNCFRNPSPGNLRSILVEIAHQGLIQKPKYIHICFLEVFRNR